MELLTRESVVPYAKKLQEKGARNVLVSMAGWMEKQEYRRAFYMGVASGSASAFSENLATKEEIAGVYQQVVKEKR